MLRGLVTILCLSGPVVLAEPPLPVEIDSMPAPGGAEQLVFSPAYGLLFHRNAGSAIWVIDVRAKTQVEQKAARGALTDMDLSPDGRILYAADYSGEPPHGEDRKPSTVWRYDLKKREWLAAETAEAAYHVEAVDDGRFLVIGRQQQQDIRLCLFGAYAKELSKVGGYAGDIEFDAVAGRVLYGTDGLSPATVCAKKLWKDVLSEAEGKRVPAHAGSGALLSSDRKNFFYGKLQFDAMDLTKTRFEYGEPIIAASANLAFGATRFYDVATSDPVGSLGFTAGAIGVAPDGKSMWVIDSKWTTLRWYALEPGFKPSSLPSPPATAPDPVPGAAAPDVKELEPVQEARNYLKVLQDTAPGPQWRGSFDFQEMAARLFGPELERLSADDQDKVRDLLLARVERDLMEPPVMRRRSGAVFSNFELGLYQPDRAIVTYIFRGADKKRSVEDLYLRLTKGKWSIVDFGNDSGWFTEREGVLFQKSGKTPLAYAQRWRR